MNTDFVRVAVDPLPDTLAHRTTSSACQPPSVVVIFMFLPHNGTNGWDELGRVVDHSLSSAFARTNMNLASSGIVSLHAPRRDSDVGVSARASGIAVRTKICTGSTYS